MPTVIYNRTFEGLSVLVCPYFAFAKLLIVLNSEITTITVAFGIVPFP